MASLCSSQLGYCEVWIPNLFICSEKNKKQPPQKKPLFSNRWQYSLLPCSFPKKKTRKSRVWREFRLKYYGDFLTFVQGHIAIVYLAIKIILTKLLLNGSIKLQLLHIIILTLRELRYVNIDILINLYVFFHYSVVFLKARILYYLLLIICVQ